MLWGNRIRKMLLVLVLGLVLPLGFLLVQSRRNEPADPLPANVSPLDDTLFGSNQYTQPDDLSVVTNFLDIPGTYTLVGESEHIKLYAESPNGSIRIVDDNGFIFGSSFAAAEDPLDDFNRTWEGIINSACTVEYYLYNDTGAYIVKEESFYTNENTVLDYQTIDQGYELNVTYGLSGISLTIRVYLDGDDLRVEIPAESIVDSEDYPLRSVKVFQFMGAVYGDTVPGYVFVPDGSGALIRYQAIGSATETMEFPYYGSDSGIARNQESLSPIHFPVTGMIQGIRQHGFVQIIEDGDAFGTLVVSPAKNTLPYYFSYNKFIYRNAYLAPTTQSGAASGSGQQVIEKTINSCNVSLVYRFLTDEEADYVGMANAYQDYLREEGIFSDIELAEGTVPALIELVGAEAKEGFLWDEMQVLTSFSDADDILADLRKVIPSITAVYKGWSDGGYSGGGIAYDSHESSLGSKAKLLDLLEKYNQEEDTLLLYADWVSVCENGRYNTYRDISQRIDSSLHEFSGLQKPWYYLSPRRTLSIMTDSLEKLDSWDLNGFALGTIGYRLFSDYKDANDPIDRAEAMALYQTALSDANRQWAIYRANAYLLAFVDRYLAVPTTTSGSGIYTDTVPFVAILLAGAIEAYGPYANFYANRTEETLKLIDYGLLPSFILTKKSAYALNKTELANLYSSSYDTWKEPIETLYGTVADALSSFYGQRVVSRIVSTPGVVRTVYANGVEVIINHTGDLFTDGTLQVGPSSYKVVTLHE